MELNNLKNKFDTGKSIVKQTTLNTHVIRPKSKKRKICFLFNR